ncbi:hypothetical protein NDU88_008910 [Pleurodeles waltl]|uniref:Uncharacterized protein n=1 Tax=Pleurodeles waltl TaxID=8319 RepID=A0AAV7RTT5_PLEWA|nr:hypothetical protein NDU88_008910 [Pleurodeles waltl]
MKNGGAWPDADGGRSLFVRLLPKIPHPVHPDLQRTPSPCKHIAKGAGKTQDQLWGDRPKRGTGIGTEVARGRELRKNQDGSRNQRDGAGGPPAVEDAVRDRLTPGNTAENSTRGATEDNVGPEGAETRAWRLMEVQVRRWAGVGSKAEGLEQGDS